MVMAMKESPLKRSLFGTPAEIRLLICGGRNLNPIKVCDWLDHNLEAAIGGWPSFVIEGGAEGGDKGGRLWRRKHKVPGKTFPADWANLTGTPCIVKTRSDGVQYNAAAGGIRNQLMLDKGRPNVVLALPGGRGTADMVSRAVKKNVRVVKIPRLTVPGGNSGF